jgi:hypothetical protein
LCARVNGVIVPTSTTLHLAIAEDLRPMLAWFCAYDKRLLDAAHARGLPIVSPSWTQGANWAAGPIAPTGSVG